MFYLLVLLCGLVGFSDFYKLEWLQSILILQDQEVGCFGKEGELYSPFHTEIAENTFIMIIF